MKGNKTNSIRLGILLFLAGFPVQAEFQHPREADRFTVRWVSQFPADGELQKKRFGKRISDLILGQKSFSLSKPFGVVGSNPLEFWVLDQGAGAIFHVTRGEVKPVRSIQRQGQVFPSLVAMCAGEDGAFYFTDSKLNLVYRTDPDKTVPFSTNRSLSQPTGIAFNSVTGQLWVTETTEHRISVFNRDGTLWKSIGERGTDPGKFNYPTFLWIDRKGKVYIVDSMNFRIQVLDSSGNPVACFGTHGDASGQLARPKGVATDSYGNIYVADALFHVVQIFDPEGKFLYSFGNQGQGEGEFWMPAGIYIDDRDHIYVTDSYNSRIQIFKLEKL